FCCNRGVELDNIEDREKPDERLSDMVFVNGRSQAYHRSDVFGRVGPFRGHDGEGSSTHRITDVKNILTGRFSDMMDHRWHVLLQEFAFSHSTSPSFHTTSRARIPNSALAFLSFSEPPRRSARTAAATAGATAAAKSERVSRRRRTGGTQLRVMVFEIRGRHGRIIYYSCFCFVRVPRVYVIYAWCDVYRNDNCDRRVCVFVCECQKRSRKKINLVLEPNQTITPSLAAGFTHTRKINIRDALRREEKVRRRHVRATKSSISLSEETQSSKRNTVVFNVESCRAAAAVVAAAAGEHTKSHKRIEKRCCRARHRFSRIRKGSPERLSFHDVAYTFGMPKEEAALTQQQHQQRHEGGLNDLYGLTSAGKRGKCGEAHTAKICTESERGERYREGAPAAPRCGVLLIDYSPSPTLYSSSSSSSASSMRTAHHHSRPSWWPCDVRVAPLLLLLLLLLLRRIKMRVELSKAAIPAFATAAAACAYYYARESLRDDNVLASFVLRAANTFDRLTERLGEKNGPIPPSQGEKMDFSEKKNTLPTLTARWRVLLSVNLQMSSAIYILWPSYSAHPLLVVRTNRPPRRRSRSTQKLIKKKRAEIMKAHVSVARSWCGDYAVAAAAARLHLRKERPHWRKGEPSTLDAAAATAVPRHAHVCIIQTIIFEPRAGALHVRVRILRYNTAAATRKVEDSLEVCARRIPTNSARVQTHTEAFVIRHAQTTCRGPTNEIHCDVELNEPDTPKERERARKHKFIRCHRFRALLLRLQENEWRNEKCRLFLTWTTCSRASKASIFYLILRSTRSNFFRITLVSKRFVTNFALEGFATITCCIC
ncbi:unnamed protein product, partial [Trichogramma brassicae]